MEVVEIVLLCFAALALLDRIFGSRLGIGTDFEKGINMAGTLILAMGGMLVLVPTIQWLLGGIGSLSSEYFDFSMIPAFVLANDMGGTDIARPLAASEEMGLLTGMVLSATMGGTVSFTIPYVFGATDKKYHPDIVLGLIAGIITVPLGILVAGLMLDVELLALVFLLLPLSALSGLLVFAIVRFEKIAVVVFVWLGRILKTVIGIGLMIGIVHYVTGYAIIPNITPLDDVMNVMLDIMCVMVGAFPLLTVLGRLLKKPLALLGGVLGTNGESAFGLLASLGNSVTTYSMLDDMDRRGVVLNAAFSVSAAFVLMDHLAWTMARAPETVGAVVVGKLVAGISSIFLALILLRKKGISKGSKIEA